MWIWITLLVIFIVSYTALAVSNIRQTRAVQAQRFEPQHHLDADPIKSMVEAKAARRRMEIEQWDAQANAIIGTVDQAELERRAERDLFERNREVWERVNYMEVDKTMRYLHVSYARAVEIVAAHQLGIRFETNRSPEASD